MGERETRKCALFVDFDNMYLGLREDSVKAAEVFATEPGRWLSWLEDGMPGAEAIGNDGHRRSALVRRCYLNPLAFGRYRAYFTRAGFSVVDCPPLTSGGKNSADIVMVMDALDTLEHKTRFDEFIIMSGDADFTPVFLRLRAHDRRTTALVATPTAAAYRSSTDLLIPEELFVERALDITGGWPDAEAGDRQEDVLARIGSRLEQAARLSGPLPAAGLVRYYMEFAEFRADGNWLGKYSLRALTEAVVAANPCLAITADDPWSVVAEPQIAAAADGAVTHKRVVEHLRSIVAAAAEPVLMSQAAQQVLRETGTEGAASQWYGCGSFGAFLATGPHPGFEVATSPSPGYLWDPAHHRLPGTAGATDRWRGVSPVLVDLVRRVHGLTEAPLLTSEEYRALFSAIAEELMQNPYDGVATSKAVRDRCVAGGVAVSRAAAVYVLRGVAFGGHKLPTEPCVVDPVGLARAFHGNVVSLLEQARAELTADEIKMLAGWLLGESQDDGGQKPVAVV